MLGDGGAAEYVVTPAEVLARAPAGASLVDAAALPSTGLTAWQALFDDAALTSGQRIPVNGAGWFGGRVVRSAGAPCSSRSTPAPT